jgi:hypothetical protein
MSENCKGLWFRASCSGQGRAARVSTEERRLCRAAERGPYGIDARGCHGQLDCPEKRSPNEKEINPQSSTLFSVCPVFSVVTLYRQLRALTFPARYTSETLLIERPSLSLGGKGDVTSFLPQTPSRTRVAERGPYGIDALETFSMPGIPRMSSPEKDAGCGDPDQMIDQHRPS